MKLFLLFAVAGLIVGSTYRTEISQYVADLAVRPSEYGGGTSVVNSIQSTGNSQSALMSRVGGALDR